MRHYWPVLALYFCIKLTLEICLVMIITDMTLLFFHLAFAPFLLLILQRLPFSNAFRVAIFVFDLFFPIIGPFGGLLFLLISYVARPLYVKKGKELYALPHGEQDYKRYMMEKKIINKIMDKSTDLHAEEESYLKFVHIDSFIDVMAGNDKAKKIKIIKCTAYGEIFANLIPNSTHDVIEAPNGYSNDTMGVWVQGVGEPVKVLSYEYEEIN